MTRTHRSLALVVGVFVAVLAVVVSVTAATGGRGNSDRSAPHDAAAAAAAAGTAGQPAVATGTLAGTTKTGTDAPAPDSFVSQIPDTSAAFADSALLTRPGTVVAHGDHVTIERVDLSSPTEVEVAGSTVTATVVYRITIDAGPYVVRDMPAVVSIDGRPLGVAMESVDLSALTAFTFDATVLDGTTLAVTYGLPSSAPATWSSALEVTSR